MNLLGSGLLYLGLVVTVAGLLLTLKPLPKIGVATRAQAASVAVAGIAVALGALLLPAGESRARERRMTLDEWMPDWQFSERHEARIAAPPARALEAIRKVRADEIRLFRILTWIRRGGRNLPPGILNAGDTASILDIATSNGFIWLADDSTRELVVGTIISGHRRAGPLTPALFRESRAPGITLATMNFRVAPDTEGGSIVTTETRVYANSPAARRRFAAYWRAIYPGSALIRLMWLRAIDARATKA